MDPTTSRLSCRTFGVLSTMTAPKWSDQWFVAHLLASRSISDKDLNMVSPTLDFGRVFEMFAKQTPNIDLTKRQVSAFDKIFTRVAFADPLPMVATLVKQKKYKPLISLSQKTDNDTAARWLLTSMLGGKVPRAFELDAALEAIVIRHANKICRQIERIDDEVKTEENSNQTPAQVYAGKAGYYGVDMDIQAMGLGIRHLGGNCMDSAPLLNATLAASQSIAKLSSIIGPSDYLLFKVEDELNLINSAVRTRQLRDIARQGCELRRDVPTKPTL